MDRQQKTHHEPALWSLHFAKVGEDGWVRYGSASISSDHSRPRMRRRPETSNAPGHFDRQSQDFSRLTSTCQRSVINRPDSAASERAPDW